MHRRPRREILPRQLTLIGTFSIGVPGFFLALAPEVDRVRSGFLPRVLRFSAPAGLIAGTTAFVVYEAGRAHSSITLEEARTLTTLTLLAVGLVVLTVASRPLRPWKLGLVAAMGAGYGMIMAIPLTRDFFELDLFSDATAWWIGGVATVIGGSLVALVPWTMRVLLPRIGNGGATVS